MPELPEIHVFARDMRTELVGRRIGGIEVLQSKCLNLPEDEFRTRLLGAEIRDVTAHGKWLQVETTQGWLLLNLGMGGEILQTRRNRLPEKCRLILDWEDGGCVAINFWWFGLAHYAPLDPKGFGKPLGSGVIDHPMVGTLGPNALDLSLEEFRALLKGRRGGIKAFLLDQKRMAGIGNVYVQDPLFKAKIHPLRRIDTLSEEEIEALYGAIRETLQESIDHGGAAYELNLYGEHGGWDRSFLLVAYREGEPCPRCGTAVEKIKTGSTSTHICPHCQRLKPNG